MEAQEQGVRPISRPRSWNQREGEENKWRKKNSWYRKGGHSTVIFRPYTPGSTPANSWREAEARGASNGGWHYRVVELGGEEGELHTLPSALGGPLH